MASHINPKTFFFHIPHFSSILNNLSAQVYTQKRTIKKLYCIGKKCYVLLCPPLQTAPPTGEAAKLASDVAQITSYINVYDLLFFFLAAFTAASPAALHCCTRSIGRMNKKEEDRKTYTSVRTT
jgi:hypothetical protein